MSRTNQIICLLKDYCPNLILVLLESYIVHTDPDIIFLMGNIDMSTGTIAI
jgi:hypothetical protein